MGTEQLQKSLEEHASAIKSFTDTVSEKQQELHMRLLDLEQRAANRGGEPGPIGAPANPFAGLFNHERINAFREGLPSTGRIEIKAGLPALTKALTSLQGSGADPATGYDVAPQRDQNLYENPRRGLRLFEALRRLPVSSNAFEFTRLDSDTNAAAYQASEGALKAEGEFDSSLITAHIVTIAHHITCSRQVLSDAPQLGQQISDLFRYRVLEKLERELVAGTGVGRNITGLATAATAAVVDATNAADALGEAASFLEVAGWQPGLMILHPLDWHSIRSERDANDGKYVAGGWDMPAAPNVWSYPVVTTPSLTQGTALVMDPAAALILDRETPSVMVSSEHADNFTRNMITLLAELRAGLAILSPSAILKVTLPVPTP